jgi:hypothetical protein
MDEDKAAARELRGLLLDFAVQLFNRFPDKKASDVTMQDVVTFINDFLLYDKVRSK